MNHKIGDVLNYSKTSAKDLINLGLAEKVENEPKEQKILVPEIQKQRFGINITNYLQNVIELYRINPFFYDKSGIFWFWSSSELKWQMVDEIDVMNLIDDMLGFGGDTVTGGVKSNYIEAFKRYGRKMSPQNPPPTWIQFKEQIYDIRTQEYIKPSPKYFMCNPIPWQIGQTTQTPVMDQLFKEWVGEEYVDTLYQIISYCCIIDYPIHTIFCFIGNGRNGKTKFQQLLIRFLGKENVCSTELDTLLDSRFESAKLFKKLLCTLGETNFGTMSKTSLLKKLVGQDLISFEHKNKMPFDDYNYAKIIINSNSLPSSNDTSEGFYRRWLIIDFPNQFPEGRDILETIPTWEYENLAQKVIQTLPMLLDCGQFSKQGDIEERKKRYIMASNPLSIFLEKYCERGAFYFTRESELYTEYAKYLSSIKKRIVTKIEFNKALLEDGLEKRRTSKEVSEGIFENGYFIDGIKLRGHV